MMVWQRFVPSWRRVRDPKNLIQMQRIYSIYPENDCLFRGFANLCIFGFAVLVSSCGRSQEGADIASANGSRIHLTHPSKVCLECHQEIGDQWSRSDHALANRVYDPGQWAEAFNPRKFNTEGGVVSEFYEAGGKGMIHTLGPGGKSEAFSPEMVLARNPMVQFLIPFEGGRWQATELAWDVHNKQWFNVYGEDGRRPEEWGHWSQRGMNWNAQCAVCHTSFYAKNYDPSSDQYTSSWKEMGINCQQCHGEMPAHLKVPEQPLVESEVLHAEQYFETCVSCHSRREDLTGNFRAGEPYHDHHRLQLPVQESLYFPDGQIKDEVFVYGSFLMSKMQNKGVRCLDCHDPHTLKLKLPFENNALCMRCHQAPGVNNATVIDPLTHGKHVEGSVGNRCVECHMRERTYMARDPRRDHGFHTPDPFLTETLAVPNACSACHEEEGLEWVKENFKNWYGDSENLKAKREHATVIKLGFDRNPDFVSPGLELLKEESRPVWKAALIQMLLETEPSSQVFDSVMVFQDDPSPLVRSSIVQSLSAFPEMETWMQPKTSDPSRLVRLDARWYIDSQRVSVSEPEGELLRYMNYTADQPGGALRWANFYAVRGNVAATRLWMDRVVRWDGTSPNAWMQRGMLLNQVGLDTLAIQAFEKALQLTPDDATPAYYLAMLAGEVGDLDVTIAAFERVVRLDAGHDRSWYNLGLAYAQKGDLTSAVSYLDQAIALRPESVEYLWAKATLLYQLKDMESLQKVIKLILKLDPDHPQALQLKRMREDENTRPLP